MANRYALCMDHRDSWPVFDVFTGQPAESNNRVKVGIMPAMRARWPIG